MTEYRSPSGEVLNIPAEGARAMRALGWEPVEPEPAATPTAPTRKRRTKTGG